MEVITQKVNAIYQSQFIQTTLFWIATVAAVVVGVFQFIRTAYQENNGNQKVLNVINVILNFIDSIVEKLKTFTNTVEVAK